LEYSWIFPKSPEKEIVDSIIKSGEEYIEKRNRGEYLCCEDVIKYMNLAEKFWEEKIIGMNKAICGGINFIEGHTDIP
jgi:hypothetical protein